MNSTYFFIWILFFGQFLRFLASTSDGMNNDTANPEAENITDKPEIQWTKSFGNETTLDMYIFPATAAAALFIIPLLVFIVCMYRLVQEKKEVIHEESLPVTAETTSATPKSPDRTMPRENTEQTEASIVKILLEPASDHLPPGNIITFLESLMPLYEKSSKKSKNLVCGEQIEEANSKGSASLELETKTTYFPLQSSEPERREKREDTEMRTAPTKESLETCLPRGALSFLEQLRSSFKKPKGNRKCKKVLRTMRIEELISDDEDTAQYSEEYLQQLKQLCNESPTAHDPRIEVLVVPIEPSAECKDEKEGEIPQQTELESIPFLQLPSEPDSEVRIEMVEDVEEEGKKTFIEGIFYYLLSSVYVLPTYFPTLAGSPSTEQSESEPESEVLVVPIEPSAECKDEKEGEIPQQTELESIPFQQQPSEPESEVQIPQPEVIIDICSDEEDELHLLTELECDGSLQKSSEPQSEVRIEMAEDVKQEGKKTFIEKIFYYLLSSVYVLPTYFPTLAGSPSTEQSESEPESEVLVVPIEPSAECKDEKEGEIPQQTELESIPFLQLPSEPDSEVLVVPIEPPAECKDEKEGEIPQQTELESIPFQQKPSEPESEVRIEMVEDVEEEGKKTFIEGIFYYLLSSVYVLPTYFPTLAGSPSTEQSESEPESEMRIEMVEDVKQEGKKTFIEKIFYYLLSSVYVLPTYFPTLAGSPSTEQSESEPEREKQPDRT